MLRAFWFVGLTLLGCTPAHGASAADLPQPGVCMRDGSKLAGMVPAQISERVPQPKRTRRVAPEYPVIPPGTITKGGPWIGEMLVDQQGAVIEVWSTREVGFNPPFPAVNRAIVEALRQSRFEPLVLKGRRVPWCTTVSVLINWS